MDFTAGLMPLETALTQMLARISPLHERETLPRTEERPGGKGWRTRWAPGP